jgi:hypothetical protein
MRTQLCRSQARLTLTGALLLALGACRDAPADIAGVDPAAMSAAKGGTDPMSKVHPLPPLP